MEKPKIGISGKGLMRLSILSNNTLSHKVERSCHVKNTVPYKHVLFPLKIVKKNPIFSGLRGKEIMHLQRSIDPSQAAFLLYQQCFCKSSTFVSVHHGIVGYKVRM